MAGPYTTTMAKLPFLQLENVTSPTQKRQSRTNKNNKIWIVVLESQYMHHQRAVSLSSLQLSPKCTINKTRQQRSVPVANARPTETFFLGVTVFDTAKYICKTTVEKN